jgi:hypothetical protein
VFDTVADGFSQESGDISAFFERLIADIDDEIVLRAVLTLIAKFAACPARNFASEYEMLMSAAEGRYPPGFAESAVAGISAVLNCDPPPEFDVRWFWRLAAACGIAARMVDSDVYRIEIPYARLFEHLQWPLPEIHTLLVAYARASGGEIASGIVNQMDEHYQAVWPTELNRHDAIAYRIELIMAFGGTMEEKLAKLLEFRMAIEERRCFSMRNALYAAIRGFLHGETAVCGKQLVFEVIANPKLRADLHWEKGRKLLENVFGEFTGEEIVEMFARMWSGGELNDDDSWEITANLFERFPERRQLFRELLPVRERPEIDQWKTRHALDVIFVE